MLSQFVRGLWSANLFPEEPRQFARLPARSRAELATQRAHALVVQAQRLGGARGYCMIVDRDGDKAFGGDLRSPERYTFEFLGGTGKYAGIIGVGKSERLGAFPPARPCRPCGTPSSNQRWMSA